jgi:hypothetical protein
MGYLPGNHRFAAGAPAIDEGCITSSVSSIHLPRDIWYPAGQDLLRSFHIGIAMNTCSACKQRNPRSLSNCAHCGATLDQSPLPDTGFNANFSLPDPNSTSSKKKAVTRNADGVVQINGPLALVIGALIVGAIAFVFLGGVEWVMIARGKVPHYKLSVCEHSFTSHERSRLRSQGFEHTLSGMYRSPEARRDGSMDCWVKDFGPERPGHIGSRYTVHTYFVDAPTTAPAR